MQDTGDALAIKRPTTKNNLVYKYIYIYIHTLIYIYIYSYQIFKITAIQKSTTDTQIRKINWNITLKIVIKPEEGRTREEGKRKEQQKQI